VPLLFTGIDKPRTKNTLPELEIIKVRFFHMPDNEKTIDAVSPIQPVTMNRIRRIQATGYEERYPQQQKNRGNRDTQPKAKIKKCLISANKVDCEI